MALFPEPPTRIHRRAPPRPQVFFSEHAQPSRKALRFQAYVPNELDHPNLPLYSSLSDAISNRPTSRGKFNALPRFSTPKAGVARDSLLNALAGDVDAKPLNGKQCVTFTEGAPPCLLSGDSLPKQLARLMERQQGCVAPPPIQPFRRVARHLMVRFDTQCE
jgi:hypothetical protein